MSDLRPYLEPGLCVDSTHPRVAAHARAVAGDASEAREVAVRLYYAVRDGVRYDPYRVDTSTAGLSASVTLEKGYGFCITKAVLLAALLRARGVPARLGFADVRNHLTSARLRKTMGTDLFAYHGYTDVWLDGGWVKATPAFNIELCTKAGILPLEWDGRADSVFHPFDAAGRRHMEYLRDRGVHADVPRAAILAAWAEVYPADANWAGAGVQADFATEVERPS
ncbi:MAG TPA: transglutaminase-like domain-containing protein [Caldimonas sp.]|nr:transglutaminase-like domain-containing protein [Caldimonas sp.]